MKIVIVVEEFDCTRGYLEYHLAKKLSKLGNEVFVFSFCPKRGKIEKSIIEGIHLIQLPFVASISGYHLLNPSDLRYILNFLKNERPQVIHCQPIDSALSLIFIFYSSYFKYKIVGPIMARLNLIFSPWGLKKKILFSISKIVVNAFAGKKTAILFAKSKGFMEILSSTYNLPQKKFRIIPLGTDPCIFRFNQASRELIRMRLKLSEQDVLIVYSGKIDATKGIEILIRALSQIMNSNGKVRLLLMGQGKKLYVDSLKKLLTDFKISNKTIIHPWVNYEELSSFYSASDIAVWPGLSSISIVDAASVGLPLIIVNVPVETFAIGNKNGFTFELGNTADLQSKLKILVDNEKLRKEMGLNSRYLVENKLNWDFVAKQYLEAYNNALEFQTIK